MLAGNSEYVQNYPVATKRVVRAVLEAADICFGEPERAARRLVDGGFTEHYDYTLQGLGEVPYAKWREYDPEDTLRFYALRLHETGLIKSTPNKLIAQGNGLALPERDQTRAEGVNGPSARGSVVVGF
jgi:NitT/TauT family transport system substrate-binding protein